MGMKEFISGIKMILLMTLLTGVLYPLFITTMAQLIWKKKADGSFLIENNKIVGSLWIAQKFTSDNYFWPRPSAIDYNPLPSGGSNLSVNSRILIKNVQERKAYLQKNESGSIPSELLFTSGSGLDPHISKEGALFQMDRIIKARNFNEKESTELKKLIEDMAEEAFFGLFGEPIINVLKLNLSLDGFYGNSRKKGDS